MTIAGIVYLIGTACVALYGAWGLWHATRPPYFAREKIPWYQVCADCGREAWVGDGRRGRVLALEHKKCLSCGGARLSICWKQGGSLVCSRPAPEVKPAKPAPRVQPESSGDGGAEVKALVSPKFELPDIEGACITMRAAIENQMPVARARREPTMFSPEGRVRQTWTFLVERAELRGLAPLFYSRDGGSWFLGNNKPHPAFRRLLEIRHGLPRSAQYVKMDEIAPRNGQRHLCFTFSAHVSRARTVPVSQRRVQMLLPPPEELGFATVSQESVEHFLPDLDAREVMGAAASVWRGTGLDTTAGNALRSATMQAAQCSDNAKVLEAYTTFNFSAARFELRVYFWIPGALAPRHSNVRLPVRGVRFHVPAGTFAEDAAGANRALRKGDDLCISCRTVSTRRRSGAWEACVVCPHRDACASWEETPIKYPFADAAEESACK